jgi:hypothetical protein
MFGVSSLDADPLYVVTQFQPDGNVTSFIEQHAETDRAKIVSDPFPARAYTFDRDPGL